MDVNLKDEHMAILDMAYELNDIPKRMDELQAELSDLVNGAPAPESGHPDLIKRRTLEIVLRRALRVICPETNEPETTLESVSRAVYQEAIEMGPGARGKHLEEQASRLVEVATKIKIGKMSY